MKEKKPKKLMMPAWEEPLQPSQRAVAERRFIECESREFHAHSVAYLAYKDYCPLCRFIKRGRESGR